MKLDSVSHPHPSPHEDTLGQSNTRAGATSTHAPNRQLIKQGLKDEYCKDTEIADWEDEGGANLASARAVYRRDSLEGVSFLNQHIETASILMNSGDYEAAYTELEAAADRFLAYQDKLRKSFDSSIAQLTTQGCHTMPPHPKALPLVKLRRRLSA